MVQRRWDLVLDSVEKTQIFIVKSFADHFSLFQDQVGLVGLQCVKLQKEDKECDAIKNQYLPKNRGGSPMQKQVASELWRDNSEKDQTNDR